MICHFSRIINTLSKNFWEISLEEMYQRVLRTTRSRTNRFFMPSSRCDSNIHGYTLWGFYPRKRIIDIQLVTLDDGSQRYEKIEIRDLRIQRIKDNKGGNTHAVLDDLFIPYKQYSLRYIVFHLREFFAKRVTQEEYCLNAEIETKTLGQWLKWLKDHITLLFGFGPTGCYLDNWRVMGQCVLKIEENPFNWVYKSLRKLNLALFQERIMPENSNYQIHKPSG